MKLKIATCQFAITGNPARNAATVIGQMQTAKRKGAHVVHFPEMSLSGYAGREIESTNQIDWQLLITATERVIATAKKLKLWVIIGSTHRLSGKHKPHNSLYIIDDTGALVDRYDKMFCTGNLKGDSGDLANYTPGDQLSVFSIRGILCGAQICHDFRYQELYREYKRKGVQVMFHSYHNGFMKEKDFEKSDNIWATIVPPTMQAYAANNYMWISSNNTSGKESSWPGFFVLPNGVISGRMQRNRAGVLVSEVDTKRNYYDASAVWRERAMDGVFHSGKTVKDARSRERTSL